MYEAAPSSKGSASHSRISRTRAEPTTSNRCARCCAAFPDRQSTSACRKAPSYPTLQFNRDGSIVAGLRDVREALPVESPWAVLNFLVNPDDRLDGRKPIDVLRSGNVSEVIEAARLYGEPGG
jgi:hypothetical protein